MKCLQCSQETTNPKFCSSGCSARFNNLKNHWRSKRGVIRNPSKCLYCSTESKSKYCSNRCQQEFKYKQSIANWDVKSPSKAAVKRWLSETFGYKCSSCNIKDWNGNHIILELEHKDGNSENNTKENLCLICPNCHSQTSTYKGRNKGNGRHYRKVRYKEGKSY